MKSMEILLQRSKESENETSLEGPHEPSTDDKTLTAVMPRSALPGTPKDLQFPPKDQALRLSQGYFASFNHALPIFSIDVFMQRIGEDYPPDKHSDPVWWSSVNTVLCSAHRLRAMSIPALAETENNEACRYLTQLLDIAPKLSYGKPSLESAQVLLGIASILRGTPIPDSAPMLVAVAIRMLQTLRTHKEPWNSSTTLMGKECQRVFWVAYILDKDIALATRNPPVMSEADVRRFPPLDHEEDGVGTIRSLDSYFEVNLFVMSQKLAAIQSQVWTDIYGLRTRANQKSLLAAQSKINPVLAAWKDSLPFRFKQEDLIGRWPKHAIVHIVVLHFRYFHTLVELNKEPAMDKDEIDPLNGDCPVAKSLPSYPHSTAMVAVEAARDALDLAKLTPRGNFQNVW